MYSTCANQLYFYRHGLSTFTSLSDMRMGVLSSVSAFNLERVPMSPSEQCNAFEANITGQMIMYNGLTSLRSQALMAHNTPIKLATCHCEHGLKAHTHFSNIDCQYKATSVKYITNLLTLDMP